MGITTTCLNILEKNKACLGMIIVQIVFTGMSMFSKAAIDKGMNPYIFVVYRQAFATITLAPFAYFLDRKKADPLSYSLLLKIFLISLFGTTLSLNLYSYSINYVSATFASATVNSIPAITFLIAVVFGFERFSMRDFPGVVKIVGCVISVSGAIVFALVKGPQLNWSRASHATNPPIITHSITPKEKWIQGCLLMLAANIIWASWLVMQAPLVKEYPAKFRLAMVQCFFSFTQSSIWAMSLVRDISSWRLRWDFNLLSVAYCGIVVTGLSYWLQLWVVENKGPLFAASFTPLILIFTAILSAFIWKEILYLGSICGGILLVAGLYCVIWGRNKEAQNEANSEKTDPKEDTSV
ncbi:hypothetical protein ACS0TY_014184 [Phlomoides rotata]